MKLTSNVAREYLDAFFGGRPAHHRLAAFAAGSLVEGIGNARSDIDLYVITLDDTGGDGFTDAASGSGVIIDFLDGRRVDVETWSRRRVRALVERFAMFDPRRDKLYMSFSRHEIEFFHALRSGAVVEGAALLDELREIVSADALCAALRHMAHDASEGFVEDCLGALESGDLATAALALRSSADGVVDALLAGRGVTNAKLFKWRQVFLDQVAGVADGWRQFYWDSQRVERPVAPERDGPDLRRRLDAVRARAVELELGLEFGALAASPGRPPLVRLRRFGDEYLLVLDSAAVQADRIDATLWAYWSDSRTPDPAGVSRRLAQTFAGESGLTPEYVTEVVRQFAGQGIPGPATAVPAANVT